METIPQPLNILERFNRWIQESIMVKLFSIGFLILILLIPSSWIEEMIVERQQRAEQAMTEVADKWSGSQTISGPVLVVPYRKHEVIDKGKDGKEIREYIEKAYFLPEDLDITERLNRKSFIAGSLMQSSMNHRWRSILRSPSRTSKSFPSPKTW